MSNFINSLIPYGTDMTPYYISMGIIIWIIGLIYIARTPEIKQDGFVFFTIIWSALCIFWPTFIIYGIFAIPVIIIWKIFGNKGR